MRLLDGQILDHHGGDIAGQIASQIGGQDTLHAKRFGSMNFDLCSEVQKMVIVRGVLPIMG